MLYDQYCPEVILCGHVQCAIRGRGNTTLLPSVNTLIARGMFCGAKYTHHIHSNHKTLQQHYNNIK